MPRKPSYEELEQQLDSLQAEISDLRKFVAKYQMSEEKFSKAFNNCPVWVVLSSFNDGRYIEVNESFLNGTGFTREQVMGRTAVELGIWVDSKDREKIIEKIQKYGSVKNVEVIRRTKSGHLLYMQFFGEKIEIGSEAYLLSTSIDLTKEKMAKDALEKTKQNLADNVAARTRELADSKQRLADIIEFLPDPTWVINTDEQIIAWNRAVERMTGISKQQILGKSNYEHAIPFYGERRPTLVNLVLNRDDRWENEYDNLLENDGMPVAGESFHPIMSDCGVYLLSTAARLYDADGNVVGAVQSVRDITSAKNTEQELRRSNKELQIEVEERKKVEIEKLETEKQLKAIFNHRFQLTGLLNHDGELIMANENVYDMVGAGSDELKGKYLWKLPHWSHSKELQKKVKYAVESAQKGKMVNFEATHPDAEGNMHYIDFSLTPVRDENGEIIFIVPEGHDITENKEAVRALHDREDFLSTLLDTLPTPAFYKDTDGRYLGFNNAFEEFFGETKEKLIGKSVFDINPIELAEVYHTKDTELLNSGGIQQYNSQVKNVNGQLRDVVFRKATYTDKDGNIKGLIGTILDVTDLQEALGKVKMLSGLLPICASCKKIRDDKGYWNQIESFIHDHSEAEFSHGICPECAKQLYPDFYKD